MPPPSPCVMAPLLFSMLVMSITSGDAEDMTAFGLADEERVWGNMVWQSASGRPMRARL